MPLLKKRRRRSRIGSRGPTSKYETDINALIPAAEREAILKVTNIGKRKEVRPGVDGRTYNHCFFTQFFHEAMNRMTREAGLRSI